MSSGKKNRILPPILGGDGPLGLKLPNPLEGDPVKLIQGLGDAIETLDRKIGSFDQIVARVDEKLGVKRTTIVGVSQQQEPPSQARYEVEQYSFEGQTRLDYCLECLRSKHFPKAIGLVREAESFSRGSGGLTREGAIRIREAVEEIDTADLDVQTADFDAAKEIKDAMRESRKFAWGRGLLDAGARMEDVSAYRQRLEALLGMAEKAARSPGLSCPDCQRAMAATCDDLSSPMREKCRELVGRMVDWRAPPGENVKAFDALENLKPGLAREFYRHLYGKEIGIPGG